MPKRLRDGAASEFICPITHDYPLRPVFGSDGQIYEKSAIETWLTMSNKSPVTNLAMDGRLVEARQVRTFLEALFLDGEISSEAYQEQRDTEERIRVLTTRAEKGDYISMSQLSRIYRQEGHFHSMKLAIKWGELAADSGGATTYVDMALCYANKFPPEEDKCAFWLGRAAEKGSEHACYLIGWLHTNGERDAFPMDEAKAKKWFQRMFSCPVRDSAEENRLFAVRFVNDHLFRVVR